jgi:mannose-6-phosphate isomerase-like protein (cupin superfamily)
MTTARNDKGFDLESNYLIVADGPDVRRIDVGPDFWQTIEQRTDLDAGRLVGVFRYEEDWQSWEMHPDGDEIVVLLSGAVDLVLDEREGERVVALRDRTACVVPGGVWHTANVLGRSEALHITRGAGTRHRPRSPKSV